MKEKLSDSWQTPQWLFDELNDEFNFDIDLCASVDNRKCTWFCADYLKDRLVRKLSQFNDNLKEYIGNTACFMNPPYSNPKPFIEKAWEDSKWCKIACLIKCDPSTQWWAVFWDYKTNKPKPGCEVRFFPKRIRFTPPKGWDGMAGSPAFPSALIIMDRRMV